MLAKSFKTTTVQGRDAAGLLTAWRGLAERALVPSGYHAPELRIPILAQADAGVLETVEQGGQLALALAAQPGRLYDQSPSSPLIASGLPHVAAEGAVEALQAFLNPRTKPFLFKAVPTEGAFAEALDIAVARKFVLQTWARAGLVLTGTYETWLAANFDHKRRKELKRQRARLSEQGALKLETLNQNNDLYGFVEDLLQLEAAGWKGERGTALRNDEATVEAFRAATANLHHAGKLRFWRLSLNGRAIAALFAIVEGNEAWLGKIAYDEAFAKFSPGTLIILDATESFFAEGGIARVDSSAIPGHPMIERIWRDRIGFQDVLVAGPDVPALGFYLVAWGLLAKQELRALAKRAFYLVSNRKRS